jgi:fumarate hydratase, class I
MPEFRYQEIFEHDHDNTIYRKLTGAYVSTAMFEGQEILKIAPEALTLLAREAMDDVAHLLRPGHLQQLAHILDDPEASDNDRFVALELLKNANIAVGRVLPGCQDTGTAIVLGYKGQHVFTSGDDAEALSYGIYQAYRDRNLRYSQMAPLDMDDEINEGCAQRRSGLT